MPLILLAGGLALIYLVVFCYRASSLPKSLVKTGAVAVLALAAALAQSPLPLILALLLCATGDWLLSRPAEMAFMAGVGAFAAGHLAYIWLFLTHPLANPELILDPARLWVVLALAVLGVVMAARLWPQAGALRGPVMVYIPVILFMGVAVLALPAAHTLALAPVAAALFILSDLFLSSELFLLPGGHPLRRISPFAVWATYWLAQLGFLLAFTGLPQSLG